MSNNTTTNEAMIRELVEDWAKAVRVKDFNGILANHSADIWMFDVPPPLESKGIDAYRKTWDLFFSWSHDPVVFAFKDMHITAGNDVAFVGEGTRFITPIACADAPPVTPAASDSARRTV